MRHTIFLATLFLLLQVNAGLATIVPGKLTCREPLNTAALLSQGTKYILIGELLGTVEGPDAFVEIVCASLRDGRKVLVALDLPQEDGPELQRYLGAIGTGEDLKRFLSQTSWAAAAENSPDGRTSVAMLAVIYRLREFRQQGHALSMAFAGPRYANDQNKFEQDLAANVLAASRAADYDMTFMLTGDIHVRKRPITTEGQSFEPMAMHLPKNETVSLVMKYSHGRAWNCIGACGEHDVMGRADALGPRRIVLTDRRTNGDSDGALIVGEITASPPYRLRR